MLGSSTGGTGERSGEGGAGISELSAWKSRRDIVMISRSMLVLVENLKVLELWNVISKMLLLFFMRFIWGESERVRMD